MKKYIIIAAAALVAAAACSKVETVEAPSQKISFEVANYVPQTRANSSLDSEGYNTFTCNAWFFPASGTATQYMPAVAVNKGNDSWAPAEDYYWPKTGYVNFYSFAGSKNPTVSASTDFKTITTVYDTNIGADDNFLVADPALHYTQNVDEVKIDNEKGDFDYDEGNYKYTTSSQTYKGVPTLFHHMLSKVAFVVKLKTTKDATTGTTWTVKVLNTTGNPSNINPIKKGVLTLTSADAATAATISSWTNANTENPTVGWVAGTDTEKIEFGTKTLTIASGKKESEETDDKLIEVRTVMPQLTSGVKFNFSYEVSAANSAGTYMTETIKIDETTLDKVVTDIPMWEMNKIYIYTIIIDPVTEKITFDPAVVQWDSQSATINYPEATTTTSTGTGA